MRDIAAEPFVAEPFVAEPFQVRDVSNGRIHLQWRLPGSDVLLSFEGCADDARACEAVDEADLADTPSTSWCKRCFPLASQVVIAP